LTEIYVCVISINLRAVLWKFYHVVSRKQIKELNLESLTGQVFIRNPFTNKQILTEDKMTAQWVKLFLLFGEVQRTLFKIMNLLFNIFTYCSEFVCCYPICVTIFIFQLRTVTSVSEISKIPVIVKFLPVRLLSNLLC